MAKNKQYSNYMCFIGNDNKHVLKSMDNIFRTNIFFLLKTKIPIIITKAIDSKNKIYIEKCNKVIKKKYETLTINEKITKKINKINQTKVNIIYIELDIEMINDLVKIIYIPIEAIYVCKYNRYIWISDKIFVICDDDKRYNHLFKYIYKFNKYPNNIVIIDVNYKINSTILLDIWIYKYKKYIIKTIKNNIHKLQTIKHIDIIINSKKYIIIEIINILQNNFNNNILQNNFNNNILQNNFNNINDKYNTIIDINTISINTIGINTIGINKYINYYNLLVSIYNNYNNIKLAYIINKPLDFEKIIISNIDNNEKINDIIKKFVQSSDDKFIKYIENNYDSNTYNSTINRSIFDVHIHNNFLKKLLLVFSIIMGILILGLLLIIFLQPILQYNVELMIIIFVAVIFLLIVLLGFIFISLKTPIIYNIINKYTKYKISLNLSEQITYQGSFQFWQYIFNGFGIIKFKNKPLIEGTFRNGILLHGIFYDKFGNKIRENIGNNTKYYVYNIFGDKLLREICV